MFFSTFQQISMSNSHRTSQRYFWAKFGGGRFGGMVAVTHKKPEATATANPNSPKEEKCEEEEEEELGKVNQFTKDERARTKVKSSLQATSKKFDDPRARLALAPAPVAVDCCSLN